MELIKSHVRDCFPLQRRLFNSMDPAPSINDIKVEWPYIFNEDCLQQHLQQLMNIDANIFCRNFELSKNKLQTFLVTNGIATLDSLDSNKAIVSGFTKYFGGDPEFPFTNFEIGVTPEVIVQQIKTNAPVITFTKRGELKSQML
ncbi:uncharacterized protein [Eurosta solidaginis]|uniref:uncharacterized protein n=1 Tax=Eurosta solidaginis TaxID=178769 RepID=UPI003530831D